MYNLQNNIELENMNIKYSNFQGNVYFITIYFFIFII